jgi:H+/Cl- antiporter ClcA
MTQQEKIAAKKRYRIASISLYIALVIAAFFAGVSSNAFIPQTLWVWVDDYQVWWLSISIILGLLCGIAGGLIYQSKNRPFTKGFCWGFFLGIIGLIVTIFKKPLPTE